MDCNLFGLVRTNFLPAGLDFSKHAINYHALSSRLLMPLSADKFLPLLLEFFDESEAYR